MGQGQRTGQREPDGFSVPERLSIEVTRRCSKACAFCYNGSNPTDTTEWDADELIAFVRDCQLHGARAVSFGGGEPLQYAGLWRALAELSGVLLRSLTTNGLLLEHHFDALVTAQPDKVHVSIHFPRDLKERHRVIDQVGKLRASGIEAGVNLLIRKSELEDAIDCATQLRRDGIGNDAIVYLPMKGSDEPSPNEVASVAGDAHFQSMSCLAECGPSPRFVSIDAAKRIGHCSYTLTRRRLRTSTARGLAEALDGLGLAHCGNDMMPARLVRLGTRNPKTLSAAP